MTPYLNKHPILALDCQTTGATPDKGKLLEIGWVEMDPFVPQDTEQIKPEAYLFKLPIGEALSGPIQKITGISDADLVAGRSKEMIRNSLYQATGRIIAANRDLSAKWARRCPTVIHFARFEKPFLHAFTAGKHPYGPDTFQIICTHEIVRRLLPELPRKGLRAVAGYFDFSLPELKRSADHALATAVIWKKLVALLAKKIGILTMTQLMQWLQQPATVGVDKRAYPMDSKQRQQAPDNPGIYRMLRKNGDVLYIGKASSLKKRVNSYFRPKGGLSDHILEMLTQAYKLDFTTTDSALEAALLETDEIKRQSPPYNVALRKRQRRLVFFSRDLTQTAHTADSRHVIGPLPSDRLNAAMAAFAFLFQQGISSQNATFEKKALALLALPLAYAPEKECLLEGLQIFRERYRHILDQGSALRNITGLGARFWREHLEQQEHDQPGAVDFNETETSPTENESDGWDPERVARSIENVISRASFLIRRARWFCLLCESSLAWTSLLAGKDKKFVLMIKHGSVVQRQTIDMKIIPAIPLRSNTPLQRRKKHIDLITYDRLRVLTTELRRLVTAGRQIELRLGPTAFLDQKRLARLLYWV